jgi:hypothetical protein
LNLEHWLQVGNRQPSGSEWRIELKAKTSDHVPENESRSFQNARGKGGMKDMPPRRGSKNML